MQSNFKKPFPMGRMSYPTSDSELETWVEQTIQREIARGRMLQDEKSLASDRTNGVYIKSMRLAGSSDRRSFPKWNSKRLRSNSPVARSARASFSESRDSRDGSSCSYKSPRLTRPVCSMRISELAAPTKRQCMASWRANANKLPAPMVNRLKQRVMDQEPIVKVSDAVNCMKKGSRRSSDGRNSVTVTPAKGASRKINKDAMKNRIEAQYKALGDVFGMKIAQLLMKPIAITLNSQLQNISAIISQEIYNVIKGTKMFKTDKATNMQMVQEVSEKVTIWIAKILEDSSDKLLEEDLKARATPAGELITLIEVITFQETDLEEQEGPVLDIIDDIVYTILHKCIPTPSEILTPEYLSVSSGDVDKDDHLDTDHKTPEEKASQGDLITVEEARNENTLENDIINELNKVIDSIKHEDASEISTKEFDDGLIDQQPDDNLDETDIQSLRNTQLELDKRESDIKLELGIKPVPDFKQQSDIKPELNIKTESDNNHESNIELEPDITSASNINHEYDIASESDLKYDYDIASESDIKHDTDTKSQPDIDVLYTNDNHTQLVTPSEYNDDEQHKNTHEDTSNTPELISMQQPSTHEATEMPTVQNQEKGGENNEENLLIASEGNNIVDTNEELLTSNVSGAIEIIGGEVSEEKNKNILSKENLDPLNENQQENNPVTGDISHLHDEQISQNFADLERHIEFAPPNDELLSDADETWPEKIAFTKPSASVTRSITSMGKLLETDEIQSTVFEDTEKLSQAANLNGTHIDDENEPVTTGQIMPKNYDMPVMRDLQNNIQESSDLYKTDGIVLHESSKEPANTNVTQDSSLLPIRKDSSIIMISNEDLQDSGHIDHRTLGTHSKWQKYNAASMGALEVSKYDRSKSSQRADYGAFSDRIDQRRSRAEAFTTQKFDYRVHLKTAPAWIRRGQGEPNGCICTCRPFHNSGMISGTDRMRQRELEMLKWCRDLDFIIMNLNKWKNWLDYISKYITDLKRKAGLIDGNRPMRALPGTDDDATWRKLQKRTKGGLDLRRQDETVKIRIPSAPVKYCVSCGRRKKNQSRKRNNNTVESLCKRHHRREIEADPHKN